MLSLIILIIIEEIDLNDLKFGVKQAIEFTG